MPLVSVHVGCTVRLGDPLSQSGNYFKADLEIKDIDTERDVQEQLKESSSALITTFNYLFQKLDSEVDKRLGVEID